MSPVSPTRKVPALDRVALRQKLDGVPADSDRALKPLAAEWDRRHKRVLELAPPFEEAAREEEMARRAWEAERNGWDRERQQIEDQLRRDADPLIQQLRGRLLALDDHDMRLPVNDGAGRARLTKHLLQIRAAIARLDADIPLLADPTSELEQIETSIDWRIGDLS